MNIILLAALVVGALVMAFSIAIRILPHPLRRVELSDNILTKKLGGLIKFGKGGAYVYFYHRPTGDNIVFEKCIAEGDWFIEIGIRSKHLTDRICEEIRSGLCLFEDRLNLFAFDNAGKEGVFFKLNGPGIHDYKLLGSVLRMLTKRLGHPYGAKYRLEFKGPYDEDAFDRYLSEWMKQVRGE